MKIHSRRRGLQILSLVLSFIGSAASAEVVNKIIATVDGDPITMHAARQFAERAVRLQQVPPGVDEAGMIDAMITEKIIQKEVSAQGIVVRDEDIDNYITTIKERNKLDDAKLEQALGQQGITIEGYRLQIRQDLQKVQLINREIRGKVNVTPEEVQRYYEAHRDEYGGDDTKAGGITVSHILLKVPEGADEDDIEKIMERASEIHADLEKGADFAETAKSVSEDAVAADGGKLGTFQEGEMLDEIDENVRGLSPGSISKPFRSKLGVHIARVDARSTGATEDQPVVDALAAEIKEKLYNAALEERYGRWLKEDLRKKHHVKIFQ